MEQYLNLIESTLENGSLEENRTGVGTIGTFSQHYRIDVSEGFPLLTTKDLSGFRWNSLIHEFLWYLSGEEHIRNLREETKIWEAWANEEGELDTAYGRFWRRYPIPDSDAHLSGEVWADENCQWVTREKDGKLVLDQLQYIIDTLNGENPEKGPRSRRLVVNAWHPANATVSTLPPCHYTFVFNVQDGKLNLSLKQRSGDIALGIPFNIAAYSILLTAIAQQTGFEVGTLGHNIDDAHIYCGEHERQQWYAENIDELNQRVRDATENDDYLEVKEWIESEAPGDNSDNMDHVPNILKQLSRDPKERPSLHVANKPLDELTYEDIYVEDYDPHEKLSFGIAE